MASLLTYRIRKVNPAGRVFCNSAHIMADWTKALSVEMFFAEAEKRMQMVDGEGRVHLESRLRLARSMLGTLDPLSFIEQWISPEERYQR
ncbi:hypothetical protein [Rhodovulum sulfidophilum]|uniref:hypothetical protein n=1 Tax=Rhodovulum sulfidophilum TaxID=35806 RepID=UPI001F38FDD3|nr:hypothetical protein [Rhodovulum sulfidophilum]MCE8441764.1 hypothetical protein [Rhodovulum sulfidophilum]